MRYSPKSWYSELINISTSSSDHYLPSKSKLRSVQSLLAEPEARIHQLFTLRKGSLPLKGEIFTISTDVAIYFSGIAPCEIYSPMPVGITLRMDEKYISRALNWSANPPECFFSGMIITSVDRSGVHTLSLEALNDNMALDDEYLFNLTVIEL